MTNDVDKVLEERGSRYGPFDGHAKVTQDIKRIQTRALWKNPAFVHMPEREQAVVLEALDMIAHKVGRIVNGDPSYDDNWIDIGGYAKLAEAELKGQKT